MICLALGIYAAGLSERFDHAVLDAQFGVLRAFLPRPAPDQVAVVAIDHATVERLPEPVGLWHAHLAEFLKAMSKAGAAAVAVDVVLPERSVEAVAPGLDLELTRAILVARQNLPVVYALTVDREGKPRPVFAPFLAAAGPDGAGYALWRVDRDGVVRRFDERLADGGGTVPTLAGQTARKLGMEPRHGLIDFSRGDPFDYVPLHDVIAWSRAGEIERLKNLFGGKVVLLGTALAFEDIHRGPVPLAGWAAQGADATPGVLLHAQAMRNFLNDWVLRDMSSWAVWCLVLVASLTWFGVRLPAMASLVLFGGIAMLFAVSTGLLASGWYLPTGGIAMTLVFAVGGRTGLEMAGRLQERRQLRRAFTGYVSPSVMQQILAGRIQPEPGGAGAFVCVLFADIRNYTTRSEGLSPQQVIHFLNRYFEEVVTVIHAHGGTVVSFMGDGIMAMFGAPQPHDNPCVPAFSAAKTMLAKVRELSAALEREGQAPIAIGIGLHAGEAVVGHVGSAARHDYTAIGDVTNVASRLESATKEAGYRLVCSKLVAESLSDASGLVSLGPIALKGHTPMEAYGWDRVDPQPREQP